MAKLEATRHTIMAGGYADNYSDSFETLEEYKKVSEDMNEVHTRIGLPLKATYCDIKTDPDILKKLGKEGEEAPCYNFLGISWNLRDNTVLPNTYFNLCKKLKGQSRE